MDVFEKSWMIWDLKLWIMAGFCGEREVGKSFKVRKRFNQVI